MPLVATSTSGICVWRSGSGEWFVTPNAANIASTGRTAGFPVAASTVMAASASAAGAARAVAVPKAMHCGCRTITLYSKA